MSRQRQGRSISRKRSGLREATGAGIELAPTFGALLTAILLAGGQSAYDAPSWTDTPVSLPVVPTNPPPIQHAVPVFSNITAAATGTTNEPTATFFDGSTWNWVR